MKETTSTRAEALERLKRYCGLLRRGKISQAVYRHFKRIKTLLSRGVTDEVVCLECTSEDLADQIPERLGRIPRSQKTLALVFFGRGVSEYSVARIKEIFTAHTDDLALFPQPERSDRIIVLLCTLKDADTQDAMYEVDYAIRLLHYSDD